MIWRMGIIIEVALRQIALDLKADIRQCGPIASLDIAVTLLKRAL